MAFGVKLEVWGEYAAFNRPEMKVERVSYEVLTPSAARGILEAIYWKPEIRWVVDRVHVLSPIRFTTVRRNEIARKIAIKGKTGVAAALKNGNGTLRHFVDEDRQQRAARILRDVRYGIEAHFQLREAGWKTDGGADKPEAKHLDSFRRRAVRGQCFHRPYLGCREFPAEFAWVERFPACPEELRGERYLGWMLQDVLFVEDPEGPIIESNAGRRVRAEPHFFEAILRDGLLDVAPLPALGR